MFSFVTPNYSATNIPQYLAVADLLKPTEFVVLLPLLMTWHDEF